MFFVLFHIEGVVFFCLNQGNEYSDLPLGKRMTRHVLTVEEILQFPDVYHTYCRFLIAILWSHSKLGNYNGEKKVEKIAGNIVECEVKCSFVLRRFAKATPTY